MSRNKLAFVLFRDNESTCQPTVGFAVFNPFLTTLELYDTKERDVFGCDTHKILVSRIYSSVDDKKKEAYYQIYLVMRYLIQKPAGGTNTRAATNDHFHYA